MDPHVFDLLKWAMEKFRAQRATGLVKRKWDGRNTIFLDLDPVAKPRMTQRDRWAQRPVVLAYFHYRDRLRPLVTVLEPLEQVSMTFGIAMPKSWSKKKRKAMLGAPHQNRPDIDNFIKGVLDCLPEDKHVWNVQAKKLWTKSGRILIHKVTNDYTDDRL